MGQFLQEHWEGDFVEMTRGGWVSGGCHKGLKSVGGRGCSAEIDTLQIDAGPKLVAGTYSQE